MTTRSAWKRSAVALSAMYLSGAIWVATATTAAPAQPQTTLVAPRATDAAIATVFTGRFERGAPVYRLPSVTVTAQRGAATLQAAVPKRAPREPEAIQTRQMRAPS